VEFLVANGAKLYTKTKRGFTPLDVAVVRGSAGSA
jgi:hypothetical protein